MNIDTLIILMLLAMSLVWWIKLQFLESRRLAEEQAREIRDQARRAERLKQLKSGK